MSAFIPPATKMIALPDPFVMQRGGLLYGACLAYESWGRLNRARDNAILILTGLSPSAHAARQPDDPVPGWWEAMLGPGKPVDTDYWHVICLNALGGCHGSTGPASLRPDTGEPYRLSFPDLSIEDLADAAAFAVRTMGIERLACLIGCSMGGMTGLAFLSRHPDLARSHINISGAVHALPSSIALRSLQREAIRLDPNWNGGRYDALRYPAHGMAIARKLGVISYRSAVEWDDRFGRLQLDTLAATRDDPFGSQFAIEDYLDHQARSFARRFDPNCYLYLSRCIDRFDWNESCGHDVGGALARGHLERALVIGVGSDRLFPVRQQACMAATLQAAGIDTRFLPLSSPQGHDSFLVDTARFAPAITSFLTERRRCSAEETRRGIGLAMSAC